MTTVILADDHTLVRQGIRSMLEGEGGIEILAEASEGTQVADLVEEYNPDVLIATADLIAKDRGGLAAAEFVTAEAARRLVSRAVIGLREDAERIYAA